MLPEIEAVVFSVNVMKTSVSLAGRATLAVVLMLGFYLLALAISLGLLYIPFAEFVYFHRLTPKLDLLCIVAGCAILWSVMPRLDKFPAPGPVLTPEKSPRLFKEIGAVAQSVNQAMPAEVYLVPDVNAWVAQRGGLMGFRSRRVMGLGLPLMRTLTRSQFRAVLAHEFGHYHGGDTKLGPWIFKTRNAIMRTLASLGSGILQKPFLWYGKMFLRITHAISRRQEFVADELAARTVGSQPLITGLQTVHGTGSAYNAYWRNECLPVLQAGFRPPLAEGFNRFILAAPIAKAMRAGIDEALQNGKADPYDTHPPLKERIAAVAALPAGEVPADDAPAITLLDDVPALEQQLLQALAGADKAGKLQPIDWAEVCGRVYLPQWTKLAAVNRSALTGITPDALPSLATNRKGLGRRFVYPNGEAADEANQESLAGGVIGAALVLALNQHGRPVAADPGEVIVVKNESWCLEPFNVLAALAEGKLTAEAWTQQFAAAGLTGVDLGAVVAEDPVAATPPPPPAV